MLALHAGVRVHLALGAADMRRGFDGLAAQVQTVLKADPFSGHLLLFRGKRGDLLKALRWDGLGLVLLAERPADGRLASLHPKGPMLCTCSLAHLKSIQSETQHNPLRSNKYIAPRHRSCIFPTDLKVG